MPPQKNKDETSPPHVLADAATKGPPWFDTGAMAAAAAIVVAADLVRCARCSATFGRHWVVGRFDRLTMTSDRPLDDEEPLTRLSAMARTVLRGGRP